MDRLSEAVSYGIMEAVCVGGFLSEHVLTTNGDQLGEVHAS